MSRGFTTAVLMSAALSLSFSQARCADGTATPTPPGEHKHRHPIEFILNHAAELNLTDAQKSKLEALRAKIQQHHAQHQNQTQTQNQNQACQHHEWFREQIEKILTAAQMEKLKELRKQGHQNHQSHTGA